METHQSIAQNVNSKWQGDTLGFDKTIFDFEHIWALGERRNELKAFWPSAGADRQFACT